MKKSKILSVMIAFVMLVSAFAALGGIEAYAASVSKPTVTLTNASTTSVKVSWTKSKNATKYTVYMSTQEKSGYKAVKTTTSTSYTKTGLSFAKTYYFKVKASNSKSSATSSVKSIKVLPAKVKNTSATAGCNFIKLSWSKSGGADGYEIYYSTSEHGPYKHLDDSTSTSYKNTGLKFSQKRFYRVRAYKLIRGKKRFGKFGASVSAKTLAGHEASTSWTITKKATCAEAGKRVNTCSICKKQYGEAIPKNDEHSYVKSTVPASKSNCAYTRYTCSLCGDIYNAEIKAHKFSENVTEPTCTSEGYTLFTCTRDNCSYEYKGNITKMLDHDYQDAFVKKTCTDAPIKVKKCSECSKYASLDLTELDFIPLAGNPDGHSFDKNEFTTTEEGYKIPICDTCHEEVIENTNYTCYIDLTSKTVSVPAAASFGTTANAPEGTFDKLDLNPDEKTTSFEITGSAKDITIDVNADRDIEIKLNGIEITNAKKDCFDIKNKSTETKTDSEGNVVAVVPTVSISAKDTTRNTLITTESGNAIECSCNLELKGHGLLNMNTVSTSINCTGKIEIKNLNLRISSNNRGIDTKNEIKNDAGLIISTDYSNITIKPNATIIISSSDDGIRCKNMEISALEDGDENSRIYIESATGDGIQLEGKKGIAVNSGDLTIKARKYAFNCKATLITFADGVSKADCIGGSGFSKV